MELPDDLPLRGHNSRACLNLTTPEINLKREAMAQYKTQQQIMGDFLSAFVRSSECFTLVQPNNSKNIESVVKHWRYARKVFDSHPLTRRKI